MAFKMKGFSGFKKNEEIGNIGSKKNTDEKKDKNPELYQQKYIDDFFDANPGLSKKIMEGDAKARAKYDEFIESLKNELTPPNISLGDGTPKREVTRDDWANPPQ